MLESCRFLVYLYRYAEIFDKWNSLGFEVHCQIIFSISVVVICCSLSNFLPWVTG